MSYVLLAHFFLAAGAIGAVVLARWPRAGLLVSMTGIVLAGSLCAIGAVRSLLRATVGDALRVTWPMPIGSVTLALDGLSAWFLLAVGVLSVSVAIYSWGYFQDADREPLWPVSLLLSVLVGAMILTITAADAILFMVGWEIMSLSAFLLVGHRHRDRSARRGAWMYLIATHIGTSVGVLPVLGAFVARTGTTSFAAFPVAFGSSDSSICVGLFILGLIGFGTKAGLMPMHVWLPEAHPVAPSPVSALMSGVVIKTGIYGLLRMLTWLPPLPRATAFSLVCVGSVTGIMGILYALAQPQYKRMLAYSSVENIGIIALGIGLGMLGRTTHQPLLAVLGFGGALLHVLNHSLFKGLLFLSAGAVLHGTGVGDMERLGGMARRDPANATLFALGCVAISALPPLNGFVSEFLIYSGFLRATALHSQFVTAMAMIGAASLALIGGLALGAFSKLFGIIFLGQPRDATVHAHATPRAMLAGMFLLAIGCVVISFGTPVLGIFLAAPVRAMLPGGAWGGEILDSALRPLARLSGGFVLLVGIGGVILLVRRRLGNPEFWTSPQSTWGCGFSTPTPRMQYTGSSYVWKITDSFRHFIRSRSTGRWRDGCFPGKRHLSTHTADAAVRYGYRPLFRNVAKSFERMWPLQHGRIQLYLLYMVATVVVVFAIEIWFSPPGVTRASNGERNPPTAPTPFRSDSPGSGNGGGGTP